MLKKKFTVPGQYIWEDGNVYPGFVSSSSLKGIKNELVMGKGDVLIATYMKSGTTWMQEIVWLLKNWQKINEAKKVTIHEAIPYIEIQVSINNYENLPKEPGRLMKTHLGAHFFEKSFNSGAKFIIVVRNPKDLLVSLYKFSQMNKTLGNFDGSFSDIIDTLRDGNFPYGDPIEYVADWWKFKDNPNILFVHYEDMKKHLKTSIKKVSKFLEVIIEDEYVDEIVKNTTFEAMKVNDATNYSSEESFNLSISPFMRKGVVGDWKNYFTNEQSEFIDKLCDEVKEKFNFKFKYE